MKSNLILIFLSALLIGCNTSAQQQTSTVSHNTNQSIQKTPDSVVVSSHSAPTKNFSTGNQTNSASSAGSPSSTPNSGSSPMAKAIDVSEMTADIEKLEKAHKSNSADAKTKNGLADAYFRRAFALTEAAQYRAALGDFRKGLKLNPDDKEAKEMHDQIISIFKSINREPPKEGEEPPPLPVDKKQ